MLIIVGIMAVFGFISPWILVAIVIWKCLKDVD